MRVQRIAFLVAVLSMLACGGSGEPSKTPDKPAGGSGGSGVGGSGGGSGSGGAAGSSAGSAGMGQPSNGVTISPQNARVPLSGEFQFTAVVVGASSPTVSWSVVEGSQAGSITETGRYSAPANSGVFHVKATSTANAALTGTATVTVAAPEGTPPVLQPGIPADISPPTNLTANGGAGVFCVALDPSDPRTIYLGIEGSGIWKTTDGGSTWAQTDPGPDADSSAGRSTFIDLPIALAVDPADSNHLYATSGVRGNNQGFWISRDAGKTWVKPQGFSDGSPTDDITTMAVDPADFRHVLLGSHSFESVGVLETHDGGETWVQHPAPSGWPGGSYGVNILYSPTQGIGNSRTWLVHHEGFWRTTDAGANWTKVSDLAGVHGATEIYYASNGVLYSGGGPNPARSEDNGVTWTAITQGVPGNVYYTIIGDGRNLYLGTDRQGGMSELLTSPESDGVNWMRYRAEAEAYGRGPLQYRYDATNGLLYAASWESGLIVLKVLP